MAFGFFITGTDTGVGKTTVSLALMQALQERGLQVAGMKPVASGSEQTAEGLRNEDAVKLLAQGSVALPYAWVNPYAFEPPIAPHIAAQQVDTVIDVNVIDECYGKIARQVDVVVVEGVGGWLVPIGVTHTMADVAVSLSLPVINVVAIKLGCLNHALLTQRSITDYGLTSLGWVANHNVASGKLGHDLVQALAQRIAVPLLGELPHRASASVAEMAGFMDVSSLMNEDISLS
jgi:dethiobiotin synthetase